MRLDSGLNAYCHGNTDFPNVWTFMIRMPQHYGASAVREECLPVHVDLTHGPGHLYIASSQHHSYCL